MTTIGTLFSGGEGVGVGAKLAGLDHLWGVEYDDAIAQVARANGFNTLTGNVMDTALMMSLPRPDVLHASPVCKNASNAKADGEESPLDIATADATCAYISHFRPDVFTLENVWGYRTFTAFAHILECLNRNGYRVDYWHLNAADYGVPQTRRRLILVARLHGKPIKPLATHARADKLTPMFDSRLPWIGWYQAIEDLIDTLPPSQFAPWQLERLPQEMTESLLCDTLNNSRDATTLPTDAPSFSILSTMMRRPITTPAAFILNGTPNDYGATVTACAQDDPVFTQTSSMDKRPSRAFIVNTREMHHGEGITVSDHDEPCYTLPATSSGDRHKAFLVTESATLEAISDEQPAATQVTSHRNANQRAWLDCGRVVKMTPRALARFQSFPDWYALPDKSKLACTIIGNAVPPLLYQRVIEAQRAA